MKKIAVNLFANNPMRISLIKWFAAIFLSLLCLIVPSIAAACIYTEDYVPDHARVTRADAIFIGKIVSKGKLSREEQKNSPWNVRVSYKVSENIKGDHRDIIQLTGFEGRTSCGNWRPRLGKNYLIFAEFEKTTNTWRAVGGSNLDEADPEYLDLLRNAAAGKLDTVVSGMVKELWSDYPDRYANSEIVLERNGIRRSTISDADGKYHFSNVEPGEYTIRYVLKTPGKLWSWHYSEPKFYRAISDKSFEFDIKVGQGDHDYRYLEFSPPKN